MNKQVNANDKVLTVPNGAGRAIIDAGAVIACRLLGTDAFVSYCRERGLSIDRKRLLRLERLGMFAPVFRVRTPDEDVPPFYIPVREGNDWFKKKWTWDTTSVVRDYVVPATHDHEQEGYYSVFQIDHLQLVLVAMTYPVHWDLYLDREKGQAIEWQQIGESWMKHAKGYAEASRADEHRRSLALLCQFVSNRYYPKTQGNQRTIQVGGGHFSDKWIIVDGMQWDWYEYVRNWDPGEAERLFGLTPAKLRHAFESLAFAQASCDPLERWYQLVQFVTVGERRKLKGDALRAETLRAGAYMLRLLYKDLYDAELPHPNEVGHTIIRHMPELEVRRDVRRHLEFVANRFGVNPQPKLVLVVEGESEEVAVRKVFETYFGAHPGTYGIEIVVLGGVGTATGTKREDRFRAILRLIDYLHHHQTFTFLVLDNENYAKRLKEEARKAKSKHSDKRFVTRAEYIRIWKSSFEFDNYSCSEIAAALEELAQGRARFSAKEVSTCKQSNNANAALGRLYRRKADYDLPKVELNEILVDRMLSKEAQRRPENRPIIKVLVRVARLAARNPLPTTLESWETNQASRFLGKKIRAAKKRAHS